jgi:SAM-dependent methyltransferase
MAHDGAAGEDCFYRSFEEKFRGSREQIKSRLRFYLPFLEPFKQTQPCPKAVDLGCGRGEWLELLAENGFSAQGIDLDDGMLAACRERGLSFEKADAIDCLKRLPDASLAIVSGFHIAEHLPFADLRTLVQESARVLKPGGLLILETPNPENLRVAGTNFYLDPTHERPLPPDLLKFLAEYYGFARIKIVRLQEPAELRAKASITLMDVLSGPSPDYAVIAQKAATATFLAAGDEAFGTDYGLEIESLAARYDQQLAQDRRAAADLEQRAAQRLEALDAWQRKIAARDAAGQSRLINLELTVAQRLGALDSWQREIAAREAERLGQLIAIYQSSSWKLTAPVRLVGRMLHWLRVGTLAWLTLKPGSRPRRVARKAMKKCLSLGLLAKHPGLKRHFRLFAMHSGLVTVGEPVESSNSPNINTHSAGIDQGSPPPSNDVSHDLTLRAFKFYVELCKND